jgi:pimeloyl-ACP methyl ester carboxylesterase
MKFFLFFFFFVILIYISALLYLYLTQKSKIFARKYAKEYIPENNVKEIFFITSEGIKLQGGFVNHGDNLPLVLYFGGNANNVLEFLDKIAFKIKNYNFIAFNYPGYVKSQGEPSKEKILSYALEIFDKYKPQYLIGRSLGTSVASFVASKRDVKGVILITPFDNIVNIAQKRYPFMLVKYLIKDNFEEDEYLKNVNSPVSVIIVKNDETIPKECIDNAIKSIKNLKKLIVLDDVGHINVYEHKGMDKILESLLKEF